MSYRTQATISEGPYRAAYDHLNKRVELGWSAKVTLGGIFDFDGWESWSRVVYVTTSRPVSLREFRQWAYGEFHRECRCEHDCCGCVQMRSWGTPKRNRRGTRWALVVRFYRNV